MRFESLKFHTSCSNPNEFAHSSNLPRFDHEISEGARLIGSNLYCDYQISI